MYPASLFADGKFYGTSYAVDPYIPRQSMIAGFRDGKETLIVESTMESSEGESFAWVVPLPAVPERMEEVAPSVMQSMRQNLKPEISRSSATDFQIVMVVLIFIITLQIGYHIGKRQFYRAMVVGALCYPTVYFFFSVIIPYHNYSPAKQGYGYGYTSVESSVEEIMTVQVGNYDVSILKADVAEDLDEWLEENGYRKLDPTSLKTVQQYLDEKWVFSVARLKREGQGELTPHPLSFTFPAKAPVFPMRLTAAPEQVTHVWLYLVADEPYQCKGFDTVFRDRFEKRLGDKFNDELLKAQEYAVSILEKTIIDLAGEKAWITALRGELNEAAMSQDIYPTISRNKPYREKRYTPERAFEISIVTSVVFFYHRHSSQRALDPRWRVVSDCHSNSAFVGGADPQHSAGQPPKSRKGVSFALFRFGVLSAQK